MFDLFNGSKKIVCPVCVSKIEPNDVRFHCQNMSCENHEMQITRAQLISRRNKKNNKGQFICESCGGNLVKFCSTCRTDLPLDIEQLDRKTIAVFGIRASGKSSYIGSLLREIHTISYPEHYYVSSTFFSDEIADRVEYDYLNPLQDARLLDATHAGESKVISSTISINFEQQAEEKKFILTLFDMAGESFTHMESMKTADQKNYMKDLSGIIFIIDPLMEGNKELLDSMFGEFQMSPEPTQHHRALTNVISYLKLNSGLRTTQKIEIPTAFVIGKIDVLEKSEKYGTMNIFRKSSFLNENFAINENEIEHNHEECFNMLYSWSNDFRNRDIGRFVNTMKTEFSNYRIFGVSALGKEITTTSVVDVNPIRLFEPLLWLFQQNNIIKMDRW